MGRPLPLLVCTLAALAPGADAAEFSGRTLIAQCRAYVNERASDQGQLCAMYIAGFVAGLAASDPTARAETETYAERALRTRLGLRLVRGQSSQCFDASTPHEVLIGQLLAHAAERPPNAEATASGFLSEILQRFHACDLLDYRRSF
jgi:hypothetical protein